MVTTLTRLFRATKILAVTSLCVLALAGIVACAQTPTGEESVTTAVLDRDDPERRSFGELTLLAGFELELDDPDFGGLSGLDIADDGSRLVAISDRGWWVTADLTEDERGKLLSIENLTIQPMFDFDGSPLADRAGGDSVRWRDAEDLARTVDGGYYVTFEREHRLWHYDAIDALPFAIELPGEVAALRSNGGIESVALLPDGRPLVLAEESQGDEQVIDGWLLESGAWRKLAYQGHADFSVTGMAGLGDGSLIVLERWYMEPVFLSIRLRLIAPEMLEADEIIDPPVLAAFSNALLIDNFEGIAVRPAPDGSGYLLYIVSDDNFIITQRTLLYQFHLAAS